jgi:hypothetical protein
MSWGGTYYWATNHYLIACKVNLSMHFPNNPRDFLRFAVKKKNINKILNTRY